jgi:ABC-type transporter Mla maintaining outer membrane lipid asymmetry permease subunit MlaE
MTANPQAQQECRDFLQRLKRYLQHQKAGPGTYALIVEMLTACAHGHISSQQLLTSLRNILREHPKVLQATSALLRRLHVHINVRVRAGPVGSCIVACVLGYKPHALVK